MLGYFLRRRIVPGFRVQRGELVVDIGSGDKPFWRGDVFVDRVETDAGQRHTGAEVVTRFGRFVDADVSEHLPFPDGAFDFSYCAHLLEHVEDPAKAIAEITRISRRGYLEVPNGAFEAADPFGTHLWFVFRDGARLVFVRKSQRMHEAIERNRAANRPAAYTRMFREPFIRLYWDGGVDVEIVDETGPDGGYDPRFATGDAISGTCSDGIPIGPYLAVVRILRRFFHREQPERVAAALVE